MKRVLVCGLLLVAMFVLAASAEAGNVRFSFGFGFGVGYGSGYYHPYPYFRPICAYRPYAYYGYAPYRYGFAPYYYPAALPGYYYRPYYPVPPARYFVPYQPYGVYRAREIRRDRVYVDYVPRRYRRVW